MNDFISSKVGSLVRNKEGNYEILQDKDDYLYATYRIESRVILRDTDNKICLTCGLKLESMKDGETWSIVNHSKYYCASCGIPKIEFKHFVDKKMPRIMNDVYKEVKEHPNYDDLAMLKKLEISHYDDPSSKRSSYDNKTLRNVWLFLYHGKCK